ncbi:hypothetical protein PIB30_103747 [Stylosanthes scabra]|uniref:Transmembrane protein n=1 Tax=Stylosanthes scabra TaxID=79078 RepID=A0ABU6UYC6_9FABA|nr:hypothetical protein [Stylosanthes scabra]
MQEGAGGGQRAGADRDHTSGVKDVTEDVDVVARIVMMLEVQWWLLMMMFGGLAWWWFGVVVGMVEKDEGENDGERWWCPWCLEVRLVVMKLREKDDVGVTMEDDGGYGVEW